MTRKTNQRQKKTYAKSKNAQKAPATPFRDVGGIVGRKVAALTGFNGAQGIGKWLGTGIGSIFGSGDYELQGAPAKYNVLSGSVPQFSSSAATNIVCHREYLGDIAGTAAFLNHQYPLNPGMAQTFPWLSTIAANYQEYRFHGLVFEFKSLITDFVTNGAPGVAIMATNYNADSPIYLNKQQMENSEFAVSTKPTKDLMHMVECKRELTVMAHSYVRTGAVPSGQDLRLYDQGNFQFATQTNPVQNLGELWVTYCVEFMKPILPAPGASALSAHAHRVGVDNTTRMGATGTPTTGKLVLDFAANGFSFNGEQGETYLITLSFNGSSTANLTLPTFEYTNAVPQEAFTGNTSAWAPSNTVTSGQMIVTQLLLVTLDGFVGVGITAGTVPSPSILDVIVTLVNTPLI